jgi:hypothetical protein
MSQLESQALYHSDGAMDLVEQTVLGAGWACERTEEGLIHCASMTIVTPHLMSDNRWHGGEDTQTSSLRNRSISCFSAEVLTH